MAKRKIDLSKEAEAQPDVELEGEVTEAMLLELCPKQFLPMFRKAKTPAARADVLYQADKERLAVQKDAETIRKFVSKLEKWFIQNLPTDDATGVAGKIARVQIMRKSRPSVVNWPAFYAHIKKKGEFELLNRAVNVKSVKERWDNGKQIPGVERFDYRDVSVTKVK